MKSSFGRLSGRPIFLFCRGQQGPAGHSGGFGGGVCRQSRSGRTGSPQPPPPAEGCSSKAAGLSARLRAGLGIRPDTRHSLQRARTSGRKGGHGERAFAGAKLRPAAVPFRNRKFKIQNSRFKIKFELRACLGIYHNSGCSLRRARTSGPAGRKLRASAAPRLRPARPFQGRDST